MVEGIKRSLLDPKVIYGIIAALVVWSSSVSIWANDLRNDITKNEERMTRIEKMIEKTSDATNQNTLATNKNTVVVGMLLKSLEKFMASRNN